MKVSWTNVAAVVLALGLGRCTVQQDATPPVVITQVDTVAPAEMAALLESGALENSRLNRLLRGYESRQPTEIVRTDTLRTPPDTVLLPLLRVEGERLTVAPLIKGTRDGLLAGGDSTSDGLYRPELHRLDVSDCDDGWSYNAGELICDRARFGHLSLYASLGVASHPFAPMLNAALNTSAGIEWQPSHRSPWRASVGLAPTGELSASVSRRLRLW